ncbi:MAG: helix-turn-helix transcriptional regulator [Isosphaeraceae bacterium]|nr:helix-turn-helix transcriptional regulator [Isosphaeraceae bacterium]
MKLAKRIRDLRYAKGWGPDDLASRAKISRTALYQIESGKTELPRAATLRRIARALGVTPESLILDLEAGPGAGDEADAAAAPAPTEWLAPPSPSHPLWELELERKFRILLASPLREGVARIVEESYRLLPESQRDETA